MVRDRIASGNPRRCGDVAAGRGAGVRRSSAGVPGLWCAGTVPTASLGERREEPQVVGVGRGRSSSR